MNTRTSILALAFASASMSALLSTSASAWDGPQQRHSNAYLAQQLWLQQHGTQPVYTPPTYVPPTYAPTTYAPSTTVSCGCEAPATQTYVAPPVVERHTVVIERKVYVPVEKRVYVQVPVEKRVYVQVPVEKPVYVPVPVVEQRPAVAPCNCEAPAPQAYVPPVVETQPTTAPCECEAPAQQTSVQPQEETYPQPQMQTYPQPQMQTPPRREYFQDRRPAAFASREVQK